MTALLAWLDHDPTERDRANRILALFQEKDARDELGLGSIRDAVADLLFPGTSTIHTKVRYFLFVPWLYERLKAEGVKAIDVPRRLRHLEVELVEHLLSQGEKEGVFGRGPRSGPSRTREPHGPRGSGAPVVARCAVARRSSSSLFTGHHVPTGGALDGPGRAPLEAWSRRALTGPCRRW